jgi:5-methylcytosine-specific restriction enzyme A
MIPGVKRPCIECGALTSQGSRCPTHQSEMNARLDARRVGKREHYKGDYRRRAKSVRESAIACYWCGGGFTAANPVQADHVMPGDPASELVAACRRCNIARGNGTR